MPPIVAATLCLVTLAFAPLQATPPTTGLATFIPGPTEPDVPEPFRLPAASFPYEIEPALANDRYRVDRVRFPSPIITPDEPNNTVHADYFQPSPARFPGRRPAVVVLHILGADFALSRFVAARLADRGVASLFVRLPYYGERRPPGDPSRRFLSADIDRSMRSMRQGVCDVRRSLAWLATRDEVDPDRLGVCGISLGGILSTLVAEVEPRVERAAILLAGGDLATILWDMPEGEARRYRQAWLDAGKTRDDLANLCRPYDPLTYASRLRGRKILLLAGAVDEVIPPSCVQQLWEAAGQPSIQWIDCGHYSAIGFLLPAIRRTVDFLAE
jgi:dienelactone hydrolase